MSIRQFQRGKVRFRSEGGGGALATVAPRPYARLNDGHATGKLEEVDQVAISCRSIRRLRRALGSLAKRQRRGRPGAHAAHSGGAQRGALARVDASPFAWLQDAGPQLAPARCD